MKRALPVYTIEGTDFVVDVINLLLYEEANPENKISLFDMKDTCDGYVFDYSRKNKNLPELFSDDDIKEVNIPELVQLDPVGMAEKYGVPFSDIKGKKDIDLMVDRQALLQRLAGVLPTMDIAGQIFYVDIRMDMLRPKDDFISEGVVFSHIGHHYDDEQGQYNIPYDLAKHEFRELDFDRITAIPKDVILVSFPHERILDPIGFNRKNGLDETARLKEVNIKPHFDAKIIDWKETAIAKIIQNNLVQQQRARLNEYTQKSSKRQRKGPRL